MRRSCWFRCGDEVDVMLSAARMAKAAVVSAALAVSCFTAGRAEPEQPLAHVAERREAPPLTLSAPAASSVASARLADAPLPKAIGSSPIGPAAAPSIETPNVENGSARPASQVASARCPSEMALVERPQGAFCIDRWEASVERRLADGSTEPWPGNRAITGNEAELFAVSVSGRMPQGYVSGVEAERVCSNAGKRLCETDEWLRACRGPRANTYPYGNERRANVCNDRYKTLNAHPVPTLFEREAAPGTHRDTMWHPRWMNDPRLHEMPNSVEPTGSHPDCVSEAGAYDMVGNLHEWVADPEGTFLGGFFMDTFQNGEGCGYRTRAHDFKYRDYSTGFRCCKSAAPE